ncbi:MAG: glycosyltransferase family 9 protein [Acidobacteria bacterium]|nr:glycosyltransferase family 9 protein [Acidobacteriota bacterium]
MAYAAARGLIRLQNALLGLFVRLFFARRAGAPTRILVLRSSAVGDFVCALPALHRLRQRFPHSRITLLTTPTGNPRYWHQMPEAGGRVLASPRLIDHILFFYSHELLRPRKFLELRRRVRGLHPDATFLLPFSGEPFSNRLKKIVLLRLLGVDRNLHGYQMRGSLGLFRRAQFLRGDFPHQVLAPLEAVNGTAASVGEGLVFCVDTPPESVAAVDELWRHYGLNGSQPVVAIFPGGRFAHKRWPVENFVALCRRLLDEFPVRVAVIGGPEDEAPGKALAALAPGRVHNLVGQTSLLETAELLRRCGLFIGNDSGPAHLAAAVGTPCVTLFSSVVFPGLWEPWGDQHTVLRHSVPCEFCFSEGHCPTGTMECIRGIPVEGVVAAATKYLAANPTGGAADRQDWVGVN